MTVLAALTTACGGGGNDNSQVTGSSTLEPVVAGLTGYSLVWQDEFETAGLPDEAKWDYDTYRNPQWHNNELQYYTARRLENSRIESGSLKITALDEPFSSRSNWGGKQYTSTRLVTRGKAEWTYGHFEIRAKLPCAIGTWPAIWMLGSHTLPAEPNWPASGEIDIMEHVGRDLNKIISAFHYPVYFGGNAKVATTMVPTATTEFHVYKLEWTPVSMQIFVDDKLFHTLPNSPSIPYNQNFFMILNIAMGGTLGGAIDPAFKSTTFEIDYVRVYQ